jgi:hypothetical protein
MLLLATLLVISTGLSCRTAPPPYEPFKIGKDEFYGKVKTIALAPVIVPSDLEDQEPVKAKLESLVEAKLREAGFLLVPSLEYAAIWKRISDQMGGFFDPVTGKVDESKVKAARTHTLRELQRTAQADTVLHPSIRVRGIQFFGGTAVWDGVSESIGDFEANNAVDRFLFAGRYSGYTGSVGAMSFVVVIEDMNGVDLYINGGGIQLLSKISSGKLIPLPRNRLFVKDEHYTTSVNLALDSLLRKAAPSNVKDKP